MKRRGREPMSEDEHRRIPKYSIGVVSKLVGVPPQTLRRYEEAGLLDPARQDGKNRLYSDENLAMLEEIAELAEQGINFVGIRYILHMRQEVVHLQNEVREVRTLLISSQTVHGSQDTVEEA
ncbi:MerR family transcriptional regulator [Ktedonobacteria bacterium brp13]|nr:MerR family transcriptional regulator [Ktedonobacteria bacterium brp13]